MASEAARHSAYAELVAGLLDVRDGVAELRFDDLLTDAEDSGLVDPGTARLLRWWQRESVREVVAHAQVVLPATLIALELAHQEARERSVSPPVASHSMSSQVRSGTSFPESEIEPESDLMSEADAVEDEGARPPTDLTARRLLVAGLTPLRDP